MSPASFQALQITIFITYRLPYSQWWVHVCLIQLCAFCVFLWGKSHSSPANEWKSSPCVTLWSNISRHACFRNADLWPQGALRSRRAVAVGDDPSGQPADCFPLPAHHPGHQGTIPDSNTSSVRVWRIISKHCFHSFTWKVGEKYINAFMCDSQVMFMCESASARVSLLLTSLHHLFHHRASSAFQKVRKIQSQLQNVGTLP